MVNITPKTWYEVSSSHLDSPGIVPSPTPDGITGFPAIMNAWSGGAFDEVGDRLIIWGGGHADYGGNEVYAFRLSNLTWTRLSDPPTNAIITGSAATEPLGYYATSVGGSTPDMTQPRARHTYNFLQCYQGKMYVAGSYAQYWSAAHQLMNTDIFNLTTNTWSQGMSIPLTGLSYNNATCVDSSGNLWATVGSGSGWLHRYNIASNTWYAHQSSGGPPAEQYLFGSSYATAEYHPPTNRMYAFGQSICAYLPLDTGNPAIQLVNVTPSGASSAIMNAVAPGIAYDPTTELFVCWAGGSDVYTFDPITAAFALVTLDGSNSVTPSAADIRGTYGRFKYSPTSNVFVGVNATNENVFLFKMSADSGSAVETQRSARISHNTTKFRIQGKLSVR